MKWFDKLIGKKAAEEVTDDTVTSTSEDERRAILEKEKQEATKKGEAWVAVLDTQINPDDIKNGFFELDWNNQFIEELLDAGYSGETNEQIVDSWFRTIAMQILGDEGLETAREMGYIKVVPMDKTKSEVS
jgi:NADH:ubiquinone oxidoreductase subunit|tara:strand:+ start:62 stop:454 length:393 start_codon:yes stop_codon:yes gene_type:complete